MTEYLNQSMTWKHISSINKYNEPTYTTSTIKGRKETGHKLVRNSQGEEVVSTACVFTLSAIEKCDLIDDEIVISVESNVELNGTTKFYEVYLA